MTQRGRGYKQDAFDIVRLYRLYNLQGMSKEKVAKEVGVHHWTVNKYVTAWKLNPKVCPWLPLLKRDMLVIMTLKQLVLEYYKVARVEELFASADPNSEHVLRLDSSLALIASCSDNLRELRDTSNLVGDLDRYEQAWLRHKVRCFYSEHAGWSITTDIAVQDSLDAYEYYLRNQ